MGTGRVYNPNTNPTEDEDEEKTSKIKKVKTTITQEESNNMVPDDADAKEVPTPNSGGNDSKPVSEREPEEDTATTDEDRYQASAG